MAGEDKTKSDHPIYKCIPSDILWVPKPIRLVIGYITMTIFASIFFAVPACVLLLFPMTWRLAPKLCIVYIILVALSMISRSVEWPLARKMGQFWFELLDFSCNLSPEAVKSIMKRGNEVKMAVGMHPHGIVPFQALLWSAYCDLYMTDKASGDQIYGFGAAADVVMYLPFLKNIMGWLSAGSADYKVLKAGLAEGKAFAVNAVGRTPRHLYILPGGIAEIFTSKPGSNIVKFKNRRGLMKLCLETGAHIAPAYVFGGTDFFHNLLTGDNPISKFFRKKRLGITFFWGYCFLPLPFLPKVTLCIADPIPVTKWEGEGPIPSEKINELHEKYVAAIQDLFDRYKTSAGYPNAQLVIE